MTVRLVWSKIVWDREWIIRRYESLMGRQTQDSGINFRLSQGKVKMKSGQG